MLQTVFYHRTHQATASSMLFLLCSIFLGSANVVPDEVFNGGISYDKNDNTWFCVTGA